MSELVDGGHTSPRSQQRDESSMSHKNVLFSSEARGKILQGATRLADAVRLTLGPKSKSVLIEKKWGSPLVCNDGVTIAREFDLKDPEENLGARMLRAAAEKTGEVVGDGTSTATILAHAILADGHRNVTAGANAIDLKRGLDRGFRCAIEALRKMSRPVTTDRERQQVAAISAHNDADIGKLVADAMEKVGKEGVITVEDSKTIDTHLEIVEGMQFDRGFISPYFATDTEKMESILEEVRILICDRKISALTDLVNLLEELSKSGAALLVIAEDVEGEALATLIVNQVRGALHSCAVKAPGFGDRRKEMLQDLAILTGGQLISPDLGLKLEKVTLSQLGKASRVIVDRETTTIIGGGVAVIRVGAPAEAELKVKRDALDDAISATRAAVQEGIVPGGGLALLRCINAVAAEEDHCEGDERTGVQILRRALEAPARQIAENSAADAGVVIARMLDDEGTVGFDAAQNRYVDLLKEGIIDPAKVVRVALENAVSVASVLLLTEATMTEIPDPNVPQLPAPAI